MAESKLSYYLPKLQKPHTVLRIPGSHTIYVGPSSCMRRHYFHAAQYGDLDHVSFLQITNADVISGDYGNEMIRAVRELSQILQPRPHIYILAVFCIDDFLGTDEASLLEQLREEFPDCRFAVEHIAPINMDKDKTTLMKKKSSHYSFLFPEKEHDNGIMFMGTFVSLDPDCEFLALLESWGIGPVRELFNCKTYEEYQAMAKSRIAIGMRYVSPGGIKYVEDTLGMPFYSFQTSYDTDYIANGYRHIAKMLCQKEPDLEEAYLLAKKDATETAAALNGLPIALDSYASLLPFSMALALIKYGFNVKYVFNSRNPFQMDSEAMQKVIDTGVTVLRSDDISNSARSMTDEETLGIGEHCSKLLHSKYVADIWHDEGYFGFHGIHKLMSTLRQAVGIADGVCNSQTADASHKGTASQAAGLEKEAING